MFVQSLDTTNPKHKDGLAIEQRRGARETLVQWSNGQCRWVNTSELAGTVRLIGAQSDSSVLYETDSEFN
jgi:hypothetical protein